MVTDKKLIASDWSEISVGEWQDIEEIIKSDEDTVSKNVRLVGYMYDIPDEEAYELPINEFSKYLDSISFLSKEPNVPSPAPMYEINGKKYVVALDKKKITTAQYIDFKSLDNSKIRENIHIMLSVILIPEGHKYNDGYNMEEVQRDIQQYFRITHALSLVRFFFRQYIQLTISSLQSLTRILRKEKRKTKDREQRNKIEIQIQKTKELEHMFGSLV